MAKSSTSFGEAGGNTPNYGGRPKKVHAVEELAQKRTVRAIKRLTELMDSTDGNVAVAACRALLDRGWGKVPQTVNVNRKGDTKQLTAEQIDARIAELEALGARH